MRVSTSLFRVMLVGVLSALASSAGAQVGGSAVPIDVRAIATTPAGVRATLVNTAPHVLTMVEAALMQPRGGALEPTSVTSQAGLQWQPGQEVVLLFPTQPAPIDGQVVVRAAIGADGQEYGDPDTLQRHRDSQQGRAAARADVRRLLEGQDVPATAEDLQVLVDRVALGMARSSAAANHAGLLVYTNVIATMKRWQTLRLAGTPRLAIEMRGLLAQLGPDGDAPH
jgi:hypothetical protein